MLAAALDLGSNTLRLLVAKVEGRAYVPLERGLCTPRLGRGLEPGGRLDPGAREEARRQAGAFCRRARELGAEVISLAATQACRRAADGAEFVAGLGRELGLDRARVLSGAEEARLARLGVLSRLEGPVEGALMADVGGGSTELSWLQASEEGEGGEGGAGGEPLSLPVGAVALAERHLAGDPPAPQELAALDEAVRRGLAEGLAGVAGLEPGRVRRLVVTAGTAATCASLLLGLERYRPERIDNFVMERARLEELSARLAGLPLARRRELPGMDPARADIILAGVAILRGLADFLAVNQLTAMDAGLLEGILLDAVGVSF